MNLMSYLWRKDCPTAESLFNFYQSSFESLSMIESGAMDTIGAVVINESQKLYFIQFSRCSINVVNSGLLYNALLVHTCGMFTHQLGERFLHLSSLHFSFKITFKPTFH